MPAILFPVQKEKRADISFLCSKPHMGELSRRLAVAQAGQLDLLVSHGRQGSWAPWSLPSL